MRVIITGGTGMIGSALVRQLAAEKHEIIVLSRNPDRHAPHTDPAVQLVGWDARTAAGWGPLADGADGIVNLAGEYLAGDSFFPLRWTPERRRTILESRLNAGKAIVEAVEAAQVKPAVVLQSSAVGYYGIHGDEEITEDHPPGDDFLAGVAAEWEASTEPVEAMGVRRVIFRTAGVVLKKDEGTLPRLMLPHRLFAGGPMGTGRQWYTWIHLQDEASAIRFLMENDQASGPYNLVSPQPVRNAEFSKILGQVMRRPSWIPVPEFLFRAAFGEVANLVVTGQRVVPARLQQTGFDFRFPQLEAALQDTLK